MTIQCRDDPILKHFLAWLWNENSSFLLHEILVSRLTLLYSFDSLLFWIHLLNKCNPACSMNCPFSYAGQKTIRLAYDYQLVKKFWKVGLFVHFCHILKGFIGQKVLTLSFFLFLWPLDQWSTDSIVILNDQAMHKNKTAFDSPSIYMLICVNDYWASNTKQVHALLALFEEVLNFYLFKLSFRTIEYRLAAWLRGR